MKRTIIVIGALLSAPALSASAETPPRSYTIEEARELLAVPAEYGLTAEQQKTFNPAVRQCASDLSSMRGFRKGDEWYDWTPADGTNRNWLRAICAAYQVGLADGIAIGDKAAHPPKP